MATARQPYYPYYDVRDDRWEYKIVRAPNGEFGQRDHLRALLEQEGRAGWQMLEKYDDWQVRFRRPRSARRWDGNLPPEIDPYRTIYAVPTDNELLHALVMVAGLCFVIFALVILVVVTSLP
jgi:hypothetical protein